jgi:hypothetical protein
MRRSRRRPDRPVALGGRRGRREGLRDLLDEFARRSSSRFGARSPAAAGDIAGNAGDDLRARRAPLQPRRFGRLRRLVLREIAAASHRFAFEGEERVALAAQLRDDRGTRALDVCVVGDVARDASRILAFEDQAQAVRRALPVLQAQQPSCQRLLLGEFRASVALAGRDRFELRFDGSAIARGE